MQYDLSKLKGKTVSSVPDGYDAVLLDKLSGKKAQDILYILSDGIALEKTAEILRYLNPKLEVLKFPAWDTVPYDRVSPNVNIVAQRVEALTAIVANPNPKKARVVLASVGSVLQKLPPQKIFLNSVRLIKVGAKLSFNDFIHYAALNGYNRVEQVIEPGEYAVRGDIIDIFPVGTEEPLRIDLFDDEVERIRTFDSMSQRTTGELSHYNFQVMGEVALDENTIKSFRTKYREAFGAAFKDDEIYADISNGIKHLGMENWLPFFYEDALPTLFDYLPQAAVILGRNVDEAVKAKCDSIADYYQARLEALNIKSNNEMDVYRPIKPELLYLNEKEPVSYTHLRAHET